MCEHPRPQQSTNRSARPVHEALLLVSAIMLCIHVLLPQCARAADTLIYVVPAQVAIAPGDTVELKLIARDVADLYGVDLRMTFDPNLLEVIDGNPEEEGLQLTKGDFPFPDYIIREKVSNVDGTIWYAATQVAPREPANGTGTILRITFRAKALGVSPVEILFVRIVNSKGISINSLSQNGEVSIVAEGAPTPIPPSPIPADTATATLTPRPSPTWSPTQVPTVQATYTATLTRHAATTTPTRIGVYPGPVQATPTPSPEHTATTRPVLSVTPSPTETRGAEVPTVTVMPSPTTLASATARSTLSPTETRGTETPTATVMSSPTAPASATTNPTTGVSERTAVPAEQPVRPTAPPARTASTPALNPLIPQEAFVGFVVILALFSMMLFLYIVRRHRP